eukprot:g14530.t1
MSSTTCRCYGGNACPHAAAEAEEFFQAIKPGDLSNAVQEAVSDYVELRGLNGLCPDVTKWSQPPGPAAFLDAGLPKAGGAGSLPRGLSCVPGRRLFGDDCPGSREGSNVAGNKKNKKESDCNDRENNYHRKRPQSRLPNEAHAARRKESSFDSVISNSSTIPSPSWEAEGPEGFVTQVLSFDSHTEASGDMGWDDEQTFTSMGVSGGNCGGRHGSNQMTESRSTPALGNGTWSGGVEGLPEGKVPVMYAKQLLRSLRQQVSTARSRQPVKSNGIGNHQSNCGGARTSHPGLLAKRGVPPSVRSGAKFGSPPFSPPDAWDDTGLFTVAPRPKTIPSTGNSKRNRRTHQKPTIETHTLADPVLPRPSATPQVGGGSGDVAVEFLDVREAALVSVAEALARRALPWQAQLCPRALQDLEIARVRVFHASERKRRADCKARQDGLLKGRLMEEERAWELFARAQGEMFEHALNQIADYVKGWESNHAVYVSSQGERRSKRVKIEEREDKRATAALEAWSRGLACATGRFDASFWLEAMGARALASQEHARWKQGVTDMIKEDGRRAEADRAKERRRSSDRCSGVLQAAWELDQIETAVSEKSWNLQGWLSVGSHKLVQQTLRAFVRRCSQPYAVRSVLWEARQAAEFAAAARAAAVSQRAEDARGLCDIHRDRKSVVRQHKRDLLLGEARRASAEDAERNRAAAHTVDTLLKSSVVVKRDAIYDQVQAERVKALAAREAEVVRCKLIRAEIVGLQDDLDRETERLATSLRARREEEDEQIAAEVSTAALTLREEKARADDREALLKETLLRERDKEDRMLHAWLVQQEQKGDAAVRQQVSDARQALEEDRNQWVGDVTRSISRQADRDVAFFRNPHTWGNGYPNSSIAENDNSDDGDDGRAATSWADIRARHALTLAPQRHGRAAADIGAAAPRRGTAESGDHIITHPQSDSDFNSHTLALEIEARAAKKRGARLEDLASLARKGMEAHWAAFFREEMERTRIAATALDLTAGRWAEQQRKTVDALRVSWRGREWLSTATSHAVGGQRDENGKCSFVGAPGSGGEEGTGGRGTATSSTPPETTRTMASPACRPGNGRVEGGADDVVLAYLGTQTRGQDEPSEAKKDEEARMVMAAGRNVTRADGGDVAPANGGSVYPCQDRPMTLFVGADADASVKIEGGVKGEGGQRQRGSSGDGNDDDDSACVIVTRDGGAPSGGGGLQGTHSDAEATEAAAGELVVFVGRAMAFHTSTIRASHLENFYEENRRRRCSSSSTPLQQGQQEHRLRCVVSSIDGDDEGLEHSREAMWLGTLEAIARENAVVDLAVIGTAFGALHGGAAVLCLAHDCLVEGHAWETEGLVKTDVLLSAALAFVALRRSIRAGRGGGLEGGGGCNAGGSPGMATPGNKNVERRVETTEKAEVVDENRETSTSPGPEERDPGIGWGSGAFSDRSSSGTLTSTHLAAVAQMEVAVELAVYGDDLCAVLAEISAVSSASYSYFPADDGSSMAPSEQTKLSHSRRTWHIRSAVEKHSALLSPQTVIALTAMLAAKAEAWAGHSSHDGNSEPHPAISDRAHRGDGDGEGSLHVADRTAWKAALFEALLAVRTASLEHLSLWAFACDPGRIESACVADVLAEVASSSSSSSTAGMVSLEADVSAAAAVSGAGHEKDRSGGGGTAATWASLNKASGVGLSPLMLLAATLSDDHDDHYCSGHPAIGDLLCLDDETLRRGAEGLMMALDARGIGVLPPVTLAVALQSGQAGFRLEPIQAQLVLRLAVMGRVALERARRLRLRLGIERHATTLATALEAACQRMAYARLQRRSSLLEAPRLDVIQRLKEKAMSDAASAVIVRATENARRAEVRMELTRAMKAMIAMASPSGREMVGVRRARAAATSELCAAGGRATEQARCFTVVCMAILSQDAAGGLLEEASALGLSMGTTWEGDAKQCEDAFAETEKRLDAVMAEFEERRARSQEAAANAADREAASASASKAPSSPHSSSSSEQRRTRKQQADFAELVQMRHRCISLCRETLGWLGRAADDLEAECADLCKRAAGLPERTEKRLSAVLKTAQAKGIEERSKVVKRLHAGSKGWGDKILERKLRWGDLRTSRRASFERGRARREAENSMQRPPRLGPVASAARTVVLAQALHTAGEPVRLFLDSVGNGPHAAAAVKGVEDAAAAFLRAHRAVRSIVAAAGHVGAAGVSVSRAGIEPANGAIEHDRGGGGIGETLVGSATEGLTGAEVEVNDRNNGRGDRDGDGDGGDSTGGGGGEAAAGELLAMEREDAMARVSTCRDTLKGWWERQRVAVEEGLADRENEAADRRTKREVHYLLKETLVTEIEARDEAERHGKRTTSLVLSEAKRIAEQFVDVLRSADACVSKAAQDAQAEVAEETEVLSIEAQSLSAKVSAALQRALNAAADELVAAQRKGKRSGTARGAAGAASASAEEWGEKEKFGEEYGESVYGISTDGSADFVQQQDQHQQQARQVLPASASPAASPAASPPASPPAFPPAPASSHTAASAPAPAPTPESASESKASASASEGKASASASASASPSASESKASPSASESKAPASKPSASKTAGTGSSGTKNRQLKHRLRFRGGPSKYSGHGGCVTGMLPVTRARPWEERLRGAGGAAVAGRGAGSVVMQIHPEGGQSPCNIKVIGVGGGGSNAVKRMMESEIQGVDFWSLNTDVQALGRVYGARTMTIGNTITRGLGAGGVPDIGRRAADESRQQIADIAAGTDLVFVTAGMGGGTGSGAAPVVAEVAKEAGALTVGVVTKPFSFEGRRRMAQANQAIAELEQAVDTLIVVNNDQLLKIIPADTPVEHAFKVADDVLRQGVVGISDIIVKPGLINVDFADVRSVMGGAGTAMMGIGRGSGKNRAQESAEGAIMSALLDVPITGAQGIVFNVLGGNDMSLQEINAAAEVIYTNVDPNANIIFGALVDESMGDDMAVTVIATGFAGGRTPQVSRAEGQSAQGKKPAVHGLKRGPGSSSSVTPSANALPPGSSFDQYSGNANASPSTASNSRRGTAAGAGGAAAASASALNSSPPMRGGARAPPPPPPPRADPRGYPGVGVNGGPTSRQQQQQDYVAAPTSPSGEYWQEYDAASAGRGDSAGAAAGQYGAGAGAAGGYGASQAGGYSAQPPQGPPQPIADSRGYYPGEKGYNPDLAPPPVQVPPQGQGQYTQGANSNGNNQSQDVFVPDGYGGFVRRPNSPPPMEKKGGGGVGGLFRRLTGRKSKPRR